MNKQRKNLLIDIILYTGFILAFFLDLTGVLIHQWLGVVLGGIVLIHFFIHYEWIQQVSNNLQIVRKRPFLLFLIDLALGISFFGIITTGLLISSWFDLPLNNYTFWAAVHKALSVETLVILVFKIGFHWRWIVKAVKNLTSIRGDADPVGSKAYPVASVSSPAPTGKSMSRREFLAVMGVAGAASCLALSSVFKIDQQEVAAASPAAISDPVDPAATAVQNSPTAASVPATAAQANPQPTATATATQQTVASNCTYRCPKNRHCSYPGQCGRYIDGNGNGLCDNGECL